MADMQEKEYYLDLGRKFKILRKRVGKTTEEVAEEIGVDRAMIAQFENYGKKISAYRINQLFKVFGFEPIETNLDEVLSGQKKNPISIPLIKSQLLRAGGGAFIGAARRHPRLREDALTHKTLMYFRWALTVMSARFVPDVMTKCWRSPS